MFQARKFLLYAGTSESSLEALTSFDCALIDAGVDCYNLVRVSSIRPPFFLQSDSIDLPQGEILFSAYTSLSEMGTGVISSAVAIGIPEDESKIGVIMEYSCHDEKSVTEAKARNMVVTAMESRGIPLKEIITKSVEKKLTSKGYASTVAGVALW